LTAGQADSAVSFLIKLAALAATGWLLIADCFRKGKKYLVHPVNPV
jgi:hypothetical protein